MDSLVRWIATFLLLLAVEASGQTPAPDFPSRPVMDLPVDTLKLCFNPDGSCVQCANGMLGMYYANYPMATLLWDSPYGRAERGGSGPNRVAEYCRERGVPIYNVTGRSFASTKPWILWSYKTGRFCGLGFFSAHYQTGYGYDFKSNEYLVMNNWGKNNASGGWYTDKYTESQFARLHEASGCWVVILKGPPPAPNPVLVAWWKDGR
jgi:hypothetical protein